VGASGGGGGGGCCSLAPTRSFQVTLALNDRCKAVNGSRILIIGVAYKVGEALSSRPSLNFRCRS
jgi:UDP-N-acetyl-D-mannosaminuronate dehydrogenase